MADSAAASSHPHTHTPPPTSFHLCLPPHLPPADFFWTGHGREQFPKIAEQVEVELGKYKQVRV